MELIALFCLMSLVPKYFIVSLKEELKTENHLSTSAVVGVVNNEIFMSLLNFLFTNKQINVNNLTFCFLGGFFWVPIMVNKYEICFGYGPGH